MFSRPRIPVGAMVTGGLLPSALQRRVYRRRGYRIGPGVEMAPGVVIDAEEVDIGAGASFGLGTVIRGRRVRIGRRASIGAFCFFEGRDFDIGDDTVFREQVFVGGPLFPDSLLEVGKRARVFQSCFLNPSRPLRIGDETGVGGRSSIFTHGSWQSAFDGYPVAFEPVRIGSNVWLPWHVFILPGVEIGDGATIGAGSVVNRSIPAGALAAGVPAHVLRGPEEWPRTISAGERWALARRVLEEWLLHLEDHGVGVRRDAATPDHVRASVDPAGRSYDVELSVGAGDEPLMSVAAPGPGSASWFSLGRRLKGGPRSDVSAELEDYLGRWGVRFRSADER